jgi:hypothetical protein
MNNPPMPLTTRADRGIPIVDRAEALKCALQS